MVVTWRGTQEYGATLADQRAFRDGVIAGQRAEGLWLLEHPPVITTGRRGGVGDEARIRAAGYDLVATERGGLATCHEPGQLVGYLFLDVSKIGVRRAVTAIEGGVIAWLRAMDLDANVREGLPGVWVGREKVCALGLHVKRGVTMHGFALNLVNDLRGFDLIVPCGIVDGTVTSVQRLRGRSPSPEEAAPAVGAAVIAALASLRRAIALDTALVRE
ncbi:octanoyltransferase [Deltaproteobacteria bacterium]|nr:octanoyltransferase [Deltaproteobacteria bacterium]